MSIMGETGCEGRTIVKGISRSPWRFVSFVLEGQQMAGCYLQKVQPINKLATTFHGVLHFGFSGPYLCLECLNLFPPPKDFLLFLWEIYAHDGDGGPGGRIWERSSAREGKLTIGVEFFVDML